MDTQIFWEKLSTKQRQIAEAARKYPGESLKSVCGPEVRHHIDVEWMYCAYELTRKDGAKGIDGVGAEEYEVGLWEKLQNLVDRLKSGIYRAPPVKRVYIPKAGSDDKRPIGIPTYEDKILQRAVHLVLEPIYEGEFYDFSYGFRPGKSAHQCLGRIWKESMGIDGGYIIDMDISKYADRRSDDTIPHEKLREILGRRVSDGVIQRIIGKWLNAGVMEAGNVQYPEKGTPQGGVISPLLSNIYLHEVLDTWYAETVKPLMKGKTFMVRYADDAIIGCEKKEDADRIMKVLALRFAKYGLTSDFSPLHPEKTKLVDFTKPDEDSRKGSGSFTFLGFKHYWMKSRKGRWMVGRKTDSGRLNRAIKRIAEWCRKNRHLPWKEQHQTLTVKLLGHFAYYGIPLNSTSITAFHHHVRRIWFKWLNRRSRERNLNWQRFGDFLKRFPLPRARIVHSWS